jgi:hypothetical protein
VKVFLEGGYDGLTESMFTTLNTSGVLASRFAGVQIPAQAVDSVCIELRDSAMNATTRKFRGAWLLADGTIRSYVDTTKAFVEFDTTAGDYYLVVWHRNHLGIMSSVAQALSTSTPQAFDFTVSQNQAYGTNPMKQVGLRYVMVAGDVDQSGLVNAADRLLVRAATGTAAYAAADVTMSGVVNAADRLLVRNNTGAQSQVP